MEFNKLFTHVSPAGTISDTGVVEILRHIQSQNLTDAEWRALNPDTAWRSLPALAADWQWQWMVQKGEYSGTFAKRVRSYYFKSFKIKCTEAFLTRLGEIARAHSAESKTFIYDFADNLHWTAGDFGDSGSCYWWHNGAALDMLTENGGFAIRLFDADGNGFARAWMFQVEDDLFVLWNGYGRSFYSPTLSLTKIAAAHFGLSYKKIDVSNDGETTGTLYINSGIGYAIASPERLEGIDSYDFYWDDPYMSRCNNCGDIVHEDHVYIGTDDSSYCESCYYRYFDSCYYCGETYDRDNLTYVDDGDYCESCLQRLFDTCEKCGEYTRREDMVEAHEHWYCSDCHAELSPPETEE